MLSIMIISPLKEIKGSKFNILSRKRKKKRKKKKGIALLTKVHEELASMNIHFPSHKNTHICQFLRLGG
jgi:hypothetical protein